MIIRYRTINHSRNLTPRKAMDQNRAKFYKIYNREQLTHECVECGEFSPAISNGICDYCRVVPSGYSHPEDEVSIGYSQKAEVGS